LAETYRVAWEKRKRIPAGRDARPWLFGVARNATREQRRIRERRAATTHELALAAERSYTAASPHDTALTAALSELSPTDQEIVTMLAADGLAPREVASILGLSPNVVRVRAHRARQKLKTLLTPPGDAEEDPEPSSATATRTSHQP